MTILTNRKRSLRVCLLNQEPRIIDRYLAAIEKEITKIYAVDVIKIESIEDQDLKPCDLLILIAHTLDENHFTTWIKGLTKRMEKKRTQTDLGKGENGKKTNKTKANETGKT